LNAIPAASNDDARTPVHLLTGFLGSGKTTLLRKLLEDPSLADTVVIINEFGEVGLDHLLVRQVAEDVVLLSSGCLCCAVRDDLVSSLAELDAMRRAGKITSFSRAVIETTGLADPAPILLAITSERVLTPSYRMGNVVTTVDAVNGANTLKGHREARQQLAMADLLVLTKSDMAEANELAALVRHVAALNSSAAVRKSGKGEPAPKDIFVENHGSFSESTAFPVPRRHEGHQHALRLHDHEISTFTVQLDEPVEWPAFVDWLDLLLASRGDSILRVKGLIGVCGDPRPVVVQGVQHVLYPPEFLPAWPEGRLSSGGWIVFIARHLTQTSIEMSLRSVYVATPGAVPIAADAPVPARA
jgi:G3E family GTPase